MPSLVHKIRLAQTGNLNAMMSIVDDFMPLIMKHCRDYTLKIDEDCRQVLLEAFVEAVLRFNTRYS